MVILLLGLLSLALAACPPDVSSYTSWPTAWNVQGGAVNIAPTQKILVTSSPNVNLGAITVNGILRFADADIKFNASSIYVTAGGALIAGTAECPITKKLYITLHGAAPNPRTTNIIGTDPYDQTKYGAKGIVSAWNGTIQMYGAYTGLTWTHISTSARNGSSEINLVAPVSWIVGDEIVITNTDLAESLNVSVYPYMNSGTLKPDQHEQRKIIKVSNGGRTLTLDRALLFTHYADSNIKAEVGLLTRRIVVQGDEQSEDEAFGAHMQIRRGPSPGSTVISGVEFYRVGQTNVLGRYPLHFHVSHLLYGMGVKATGNSIHQSYQRCISIHEAHGILLEDNVAFDIVGHCYFLEDGSEMGTVLNHNLGARVLPMVPPLLYHDNRPSVFWISNPNNTLTNNAASGSLVGYWYAMPVGVPNGAGGLAYPKMNALGLPFGGFANNIVHSMNGWCIDSATMDNYDKMTVMGWGGPNIVWTNITSYKCTNGSIWNRGRPADVVGGYWADFGQMGFFPLNGQIAYNVTLVARSQNVGLYPPKTESCGVSNYDTGAATGSIGLTFINFTGPRYGAFCDTIGSPQFIPPLNWGIRNKFINSNPTFITGGQYAHYGVSMRAFLDDGSGTGIPYGAFMAGYQPYWNVSSNGGFWVRDSNSITLPYFHGGLAEVTLTGPKTDVPTLDTKKYGITGLYRTAIYWRPLGQNITAPGMFATEWAGYSFAVSFPTNTMWTGLLISKDTGFRRSMLSDFTLDFSGKVGDWVILSLPFNQFPTDMVMKIDKREFTAVKKFSDLTEFTYFWNTEDNHLYLVMSCGDDSGSYSAYTRSDYYVYSSVCTLSFSSLYRNYTNVTESTYTPPKPPTTLPNWAAYTKFTAKMYHKASDVGAMVKVQLFQKGFTGYPAIAWQTYQNQTDYTHRIRFKDANGKVLWNTDPTSKIGAGNKRYITAEFWNQINQGLVYVAMDVNGKELMRGQLLTENAQSNTVMSVANSGFSCAPQYKTMDLFSDAIYNNSATISVLSGFSGAKALAQPKVLCGNSSLYLSNTILYYGNLNISLPILPYINLATYSSLEFAVIGNQTDTVLDLTVWSRDKQSVIRKVKVDGSNNYNRIIDGRSWAIVRIPLSLLGGNSIASVGLYASVVNPELGAVYFFVDQLRLAANSSTVPAPVFTSTKPPTVGVEQPDISANPSVEQPEDSSTASAPSGEQATTSANVGDANDVIISSATKETVKMLMVVILAIVFCAV